jgi:hypothetical protein
MTGKWRKLTTSSYCKFSEIITPQWSKSAVFPGGSSLSAQTYSSLTNVQKSITLKPFVLSRRANNRQKHKRVLYNSCMGLPLRFHPH